MTFRLVIIFGYVLGRLLSYCVKGSKYVLYIRKYIALSKSNRGFGLFSKRIEIDFIVIIAAIKFAFLEKEYN